MWYTVLHRTQEFWNQLPKTIILQIEKYAELNSNDEDKKKTTVVNSTGTI